jgi:3-hydroxyacyl-CoA dehydrogenase/enoyl-CoA hydratase/carnithine racemase
MSQIFNLRVEEGIGVITFDVVGDTMNTWTDAAFEDFARLMGDVEKEKGLKGIIFISGKPDNFLSGANLKTMSQVESADVARNILNLFHGCFARMSQLGYPSLAAIHGHCLGGGLEFALACTARIAREGKTTIIGLPECNVGLFPGGGGTQRLPRLIGYPAFELVLRGKMLPAAKALELGIIDRLIPADADLLTAAKTFLGEISAKTADLKRPVQDFSQVDAVADMAKQGILKATKGREIPGPIYALDSMHRGVKLSLEEGLELEKENFVKVILSNQAKGGINTFFIKGMTDKPKGMMTKGFVPKVINKAAVLGFGTMGRGIIIDILRNTKIPVLVKDIPEALEPGKAFLRKILGGMAEKKRLKEPVEDLMARLTATSDYIEAFKEVDIVIEAVFEEIGVKKQVYGELSKVIREDCIVASNTSSIPITSMAPFVANPARFGGIHFFSPVWLMELVEVIRGEQTSQDTIDNLLNFTGLIRKRPIVCLDNPGFVVNALLFPYLKLALEYVGAGNSIEKVDGAVTAFGMPVGPIRLTDEVGIDVPYKAMKGMGFVEPTLKNVVEAGRCGLKKSGKGFFLKDGSVDPEVLPLIAKGTPKEVSVEEMQNGFNESMLKVGKDLLDRKIVSSPAMIDVGMIWGTGFPPDKGGPMKWGDLTGLSEKLFGKKFYK